MDNVPTNCRSPWSRPQLPSLDSYLILDFMGILTRLKISECIERNYNTSKNELMTQSRNTVPFIRLIEYDRIFLRSAHRVLIPNDLLYLFSSTIYVYVDEYPFCSSNDWVVICPLICHISKLSMLHFVVLANRVSSFFTA